MKEFVIVTDTTTDLPREYVEKHHLYMMSLPYTLEGTSYTWENPMPVKEFYDKMRAGSLPTTSQANPEEAATLYESMIFRVLSRAESHWMKIAMGISIQFLMIMEKLPCSRK